LLRKLHELEQRGINLDEAEFFYYDFDWSRDADTSHTFFVLHKGKIVDEVFSFNGRCPMVLERYEDKDPIWMSHAHLDKAKERYWYRKFYTETFMGQMMVLRPDEPILYHYTRPSDVRAGHDSVLLLAPVEFALVKVDYLALVVVLLAAIAFPKVRQFEWVAIGLAASCVLQLALALWRGRRVGKS
jgi:hypothetical protein